MMEYGMCVTTVRRLDAWRHFDKQVSRARECQGRAGKRETEVSFHVEFDEGDRRDLGG